MGGLDTIGAYDTTIPFLSSRNSDEIGLGLDWNGEYRWMD